MTTPFEKAHNRIVHQIADVLDDIDTAPATTVLQDALKLSSSSRFTSLARQADDIARFNTTIVQRKFADWDRGLWNTSVGATLADQVRQTLTTVNAGRYMDAVNASSSFTSSLSTMRAELFKSTLMPLRATTEATSIARDFLSVLQKTRDVPAIKPSTYAFVNDFFSRQTVSSEQIVNTAAGILEQALERAMPEADSRTESVDVDALIDDTEIDDLSFALLQAADPEMSAEIERAIDTLHTGLMPRRVLLNIMASMLMAMCLCVYYAVGFLPPPFGQAASAILNTAGIDGPTIYRWVTGNQRRQQGPAISDDDADGSVTELEE